MEKYHGLHKDFLSFVVKDLSAYILAILAIIVVLIYSFTVLVIRDAPSREKGWAMLILASLLTGAIGFALVKSVK